MDVRSVLTRRWLGGLAIATALAVVLVAVAGLVRDGGALGPEAVGLAAAAAFVVVVLAVGLRGGVGRTPYW